MKFPAILCFFFFLRTINVSAQPDVKGYKVGMEFDPIMVSIVGHQYSIYGFCYEYKNTKYCGCISGSSSVMKKYDYSDGQFITTRFDISEEEIQNLVTAFENKYQIKFAYNIDSKKGKRTWNVTKGEYYYQIEVNSTFNTNAINFDIENKDAQQNMRKEKEKDTEIKNKILRYDL